MVFYYLVLSCMVGQSFCLIQAMVQRRINNQRRQDEENDAGEAADEDESLFMEGLFGGMLSIPLPVPEIIS